MTKSIVPESDLLNGMSEFLNVDASGGGDKRSSKVDGMLIPPSSAPGGAMGAIGGEKFGGGINDLRFPIIKCSTPIGLVQTRVIRTADLLKRDYSTWYAKSQFAQDRQYRPAYLRKGDGKLINGGSGISGGGVNSSSNNKTGGKSGDVAGVKSGIYHFLKPVELTDINDVVFTVQKFAKNIKSRN